MSEQLGVITTGGTIGSILSGKAMTVDPEGEIVRTAIEDICAAQGLSLALEPAFNKNSEDLTPADWGVLIAAVEKMLARGITRIVVTHGTDTLAYSAAALALAFQGRVARICLTGSCHPLTAPDSDGPLNLKAAFAAVAGDALPAGIYVAFRNDATNDSAVLLSAADVKPMAYDDDAFSSLHGRCVTIYDPEEGLDKDAARLFEAGLLPELPDGVLNLDEKKLSAAAQSVLMLESYPGLSFRNIDRTRLKVLLLGLYHSGTGHSVRGDGSLLEFVTQKNHKLPVLAATFGAKDTAPYESTVKLMDAGVKVITDLPLHLVLTFTVLALASGASADDAVMRLAKWVK